MARITERASGTRLYQQCEYETQLASQLRDANRSSRLPLYGLLAAEYAARFPEHLPEDAAQIERTLAYDLSFFRRFVAPGMTIAEVGPGRGHLAFALAPLAGKVYGVDVSEVYLPATRPTNFEFRLTDGLHMPFDPDSLDLVVSNQLMEHLHPDDAAGQLHEIHRVLKPGGRYVCITPSPTNGPHDCSAYFDEIPCPLKGKNYVATGFHMKEYTSRELTDLFHQAGFRQVQTWIGARAHYVRLPARALELIEGGLQLIPAPRRKRSSLLGVVLGNRVVATK